MRNLNNLDDMLCVLVDAEQPVRAILADGEVKNLWKKGTYLDAIFYMLRAHRAELYAVVSALDGEVTPEEVPGKYGVSGVIHLFAEAAKCAEVRELFGLFTAAGKKKSAVSSGSAPVNTVE